ncbi:MAG: pantetheine-phosphate adenylyltransferase [Leptolinea sp.]|nr:pantetheine-phosphate adenylyltransferase [Leptolinea sp.]
MIRAFFPGSFDPIHYGHIDIASRASRLFDEVVIGVYNKPMKNMLFTPEERIAMAKRTFEEEPKIVVQGYNKLTVDFAREINAKVIVRGLRVFSDFEYEFRMALANHRLAQDIEVVALITNEEHTFLSSTTVREIASLGGNISTMVPSYVAEALNQKFAEMNDDRPNVHMTSLRD